MSELVEFEALKKSGSWIMVKYYVLSLVTGYIIANFFDWSNMCKKPHN